MTTLIAPDGREYRTSNLLEIKRLVNGRSYTIKPEGNAKEPFDPAQHTVKEVAAYIRDHPDDADRVRAAEVEGQNRTTIVGD